MKFQSIKNYTHIKKFSFLSKSSILLLASFSFSYGAGITCTDYNDFKQFNGHYYTATVKKMTFDEAKKLAKDSGGYLAIPNSKTENDFLVSLVKGANFAWIGIHDSNYTQNFCKEGSAGCIYDSSRFKTIKGEALSYKNFASKQPNNLLKQYDIVNGKEKVSPLGEHWVAMAAPSGQWADLGNHFGTNENPIKNYALLEFEKLPDCAGGGSSGGSNQKPSTTMQCNTNFSDDPNFKPNGESKNIACLQNSKQEYFCPVQLTQCVNKDEAVDGGSKRIEGGVLNTSKTKVIITLKNSNYAMGILEEKQLQITNLDQVESFKLTNAKTNAYVVPYAPNAKVNLLDKGNKWNPMKYPNNVKDALDYIPNKPANDIYGNVNSFSDKNLNIELKSFLHQGINTLTLFASGTRTQKGSYELRYEAVGQGITCRDFGNSLDCKEEVQTVPFYAYEYTCPAGYQPKEKGGTCSPNSLNDLIDTNNDGIGDSCNSSIPPAKNCLGSSKTCPFNKDRECVLVDNKYQCSPFPCYSEANDIEDTDTPVGLNDSKNDGWNDDGTCSGNIIIFNGQDNRCKNWDMFAGLLGGGCCNKDNVFLGLVPCKEEEKKLAKLNQQRRCVEIGEYCSKKIRLGFAKICVEKKKSFCCFNSKLGRIFNEQGRKQLGRGWGSGASPKCTGFKPEEFQKLDFSEIDLSEFIADIIGSVDVDKIKADSLKIQERIDKNIQNAVPKP
ncbi:conjugal transfer protein TraN [Campylobacter upsaliensis]|uniref:conjugal transfer protein TraN n=1 Tax=Campylobacter upsaliensis TaxID=28080 RepID=UPI002149D65F|nr:conjugal transfer protein TraN [Campylobacter upsaliensis]MCR2114037.1 conjugal transfer protein TraN [Campylobacter upsaliensis]MCR2122698.1 conjugal transfer protein TraN [Campylobacter upsaliensis]MCR2123859.1 conjugal transfer protein TraN [Campylobacter upsaliensis]